MNQHLLRCYEFGPFCLNATDKLLHRGDKVVALTPKLVDTLVVLVENSGHVVTKEELLQTLWPDSFVEESSLTQNISLLRKALAEDGSPQYIETIPKRGYRFVAAVREVSWTAADLLRQETNNVPSSEPDLPAALITLPVPIRRASRNAYLALVAVGIVMASVVTLYFVRRTRPTDQAIASKQIAVLRTTKNPEAYKAYVSGLYFWNKRGTDNLRKAISYLEESVNKDGGFAPAHAILADCYYLNAENDLGILPRAEALIRARTEISKALELDASLAEAHTVKACLAIVDYDFGSAECEFRRAIELNPNYPLAHLRYSYLLLGQGKLQDAVAQMQQAQDLDPASAISNTARGLMLYMSRDYDGAIQANKKALELQPDLIAARANLAMAYATKGMFHEAAAEFVELKNGDALLAAKAEIYALGLAGRTADARQRLSELLHSADEKKIGAYDYVVLYSALGDKDKAFEWLEKVDVKGFGRLKFDPELDLLRGDVRFAQFLSRLTTKLIHPPGESS
jgi:DNA-binding winged helix-turn-helix (wHTH) protein/Flp pilus assembly protein TadD